MIKDISTQAIPSQQTSSDRHWTSGMQPVKACCPFVGCLGFHHSYLKQTPRLELDRMRITPLVILNRINWSVNDRSFRKLVPVDTDAIRQLATRGDTCKLRKQTKGFGGTSAQEGAGVQLVSHADVFLLLETRADLFGDLVQEFPIANEVEDGSTHCNGDDIGAWLGTSRVIDKSWEFQCTIPATINCKDSVDSSLLLNGWSALGSLALSIQWKHSIWEKSFPHLVWAVACCLIQSPKVLIGKRRLAKKMRPSLYSHNFDWTKHCNVWSDRDDKFEGIQLTTSFRWLCAVVILVKEPNLSDRDISELLPWHLGKDRWLRQRQHSQKELQGLWLPSTSSNRQYCYEV